MATVENPHAGQGAVVLDIGGDIGALVVTAPADMDGVEVEIVPAGTARTRTHGHPHPLHVAVVGRPVGDTVIHALVYPELPTGTYDLYRRPDGPVQLTATVHGGHVTETSWPPDPSPGPGPTPPTPR